MREMNLLPEEHFDQLDQKKKKRKYTFLIVGMILILAASYLSVYFAEYNLREEIVKTEKQIENLEKVSEAQVEISVDQEVLEQRMKMLDLVENKRVDYHQFIKQLEKTIPDEVTLQNLSYSGNQDVNINATTTKADEIADFMANIAKIEGVENVILEDIHFGSGGDQQGSIPSFNIHFRYQAEEGGQSDDLK